ncbi:ATP-grasp domain-containing protein [Gammaproteobacteria bacterium]|nr:ATP-grasp domain-containing protein [Gammaproteobacteria bacterium]
MKRKILLEKITPTNKQIEHLYELLLARKHFVSHESAPAFQEHYRFVKNNPYRSWFLIHINKKICGSIYVQFDNSIGINCIQDSHYDFLESILTQLKENILPLPAIASLRNKDFHLNVPITNTRLHLELGSMSFRPLQVSFAPKESNIHTSPSIFDDQKIKNKKEQKYFENLRAPSTQAKIFDTSQFGSILLTSCSAKVRLVASIKQGVSQISNSIKIVGGDISSGTVSSYFVDDFWRMPPLQKITPANFVKECKARNISAIIPSRDDELEYFSIHRAVFLKQGIHTMISKPQSITRCLDKLKFSKLQDLNIIPSFISIKNSQYNRFVVKERFGSGSDSVGINLKYSDAIEHSKLLKHPIFQPFIPGKELSVDAYVTTNNQVKGIVIRERVLVVHGESKITKTIIDPTLERVFLKAIRKLNLYGHIMLQAIIGKNNSVHIIECNPRFGGASSISIQSGLDSFYWFYLETMGLEIKNYPFKKLTKELTQIRYSMDIYQ